MNLRPAPTTPGRKWAWKLVSTLSGMLGALIARKLMRAGYRAVSKDNDADMPFEPTNPRFSLPDALFWAAAAGIGLGIAKVFSARVAVIGWEVATGTLPPGVVEEEPESA